MNARCIHCEQVLEGLTSHHVCPACGMPQPVLSHDDYFSAMGILRGFKPDTKALESRFYELSRLLHPDRFTTASVQIKSLSLARMSLINEAYRTLKNPTSLREYLLSLEKVQTPKAAMPASLAEVWFEIQDLFIENPKAAREKLLSFEKELTQQIQEVESQILLLEDRYAESHLSDNQAISHSTNQAISHSTNQTISHSILQEIAQKIQTQSYLNSMQKDVDRIKKNAYTN